jgi:phosphoribosylamine--glycine ligase
MNVLLIGGGGREHALAFAISRSPLLTKLHAAPGNAGIAEFAEIEAVDVDDHGAVIAFARANGIGLVVVGPEAPLVAGLADALVAAGIAVFGPGAAAARLEGSKGFTKELCHEAGVPTGEYAWLETAADADAYLMGLDDGRLVVKADGLAAGKGVYMCESLDDARRAVAGIFAGRFGTGASVVIEEWLDGEEISFFALCDGETALPFGSAQDHKRAFDGDTGPNTGGMGAYSPAGPMTPALEAEIMDRIVTPTIRTMAARGTPFRGVLFAGLMLTADGPMLLEYNVRFGDPEAQVLAMRLESDLLALMLAATEGRLDGEAARWSARAAMTVVMAAKGYPGAYETGSAIRGLDAAAAVPGVRIFHAGTARRDGTLVAAGGRVLNVTAVGRDIAEARARAYAAVDRIDWPGGFARRDIGWRALRLAETGT